jgi:hypothetical protein
MPKVNDLFRVAKGKGGYIRDYDPGTTPLVSATSLRNGVVGFINAMPEFKAPAITVERVTGSAFVQLVDFSAVPDDVSVLIPKRDMGLDKLYMISSFINNSRWRFSFARKLTPTRLRDIVIPDVEAKHFHLDSPYSILPKVKTKRKSILVDIPKFRKFQITDLFDIVRGDFHALSRLSPGNIPTVSRVAYDNGIVGYFAKPARAKLYPPLTITVSTVTGDAFVQTQPFIVTDNVLVLLPKAKYIPTTLFFIQTMINKEKWRCTYGRQLYKAKFEKMQIALPVKVNGELDEHYAKIIIQSSPYWEFLESVIKKARQVDFYHDEQLRMTFEAT